MTAEELIKRLKSLPSETPVLVEGYETGFDEIVDLKALEVFRLDQPAEWEGEYNRRAELPCSDSGIHGGLEGLLDYVKSDEQFTAGESRDSAIYHRGASRDHAIAVSAVVLIGRRGHLRKEGQRNEEKKNL